MPRAALLRGSAGARDRRTPRLLRRNGQEPHTPRPGSASTGGRTMRIEEQLRDAIDKHVGKPRADETAWSDLQRRVESTSAAEVAHGTQSPAGGGHRGVRRVWRSGRLAVGDDLVEPDHPVGELRSARDHPGWVDPAAPASWGERWNGGSLDRDTASVVGRVRGVGQARRGRVRLRPRHADVGPHPTCPSRAIGGQGCVDRLRSDLPRVDGTAITRNPTGLPSIRHRRHGERSPRPRSTLRERWWCGRGRN